MLVRQIVLDTETTGLSPQQGHRVIEIGCVELLNRRLTGKTFHTYLEPDRKVDEGAVRVHGITNAFLAGKPRFAEIAAQFKAFIQGAELIIHNASFDVGFLENEFKLIKDKGWRKLENHCSILDTLLLAREKHPGQRNNLDALCKRYNVNNQHRDKHGALLDATILADVYLFMTGGQNTLTLDEPVKSTQNEIQLRYTLENTCHHIEVPFLSATPEELSAHRDFLKEIAKQNGSVPLWESLNI